MNANKCPECKSTHTERAKVEWPTHGVVAVYVCHGCPTTFVNRYSLTERETKDVIGG